MRLYLRVFGFCLIISAVLGATKWLGLDDSGFTNTPSVELKNLANMESERAAHTLSYLGRDRILIAGGMTMRGPLAEAIIYNHKESAFEKVGPMYERRQSHTADVDDDGQIVLIGGYNEKNIVTSSVERFNPQNNTFTKIGNLLQERSGHLSQKISSNELLLVGGVGKNWQYLNSAEIFNLRTGKSRFVGSMADPREAHILQSLGDGKFLVTGGHSGRREKVMIYDSAEIFDSKTEQFRVVGPMTSRRHKHDSIILDDGRVLILGGADQQDSQGVYNSVEVYDPETESFSYYGEMNSGRYKHDRTTIAIGDGLFLLAGGSSKMEILDSNKDQFIPINHTQSLFGQFSSACYLGEDKVLISGGYGNGRLAVNKMWEAKIQRKRFPKSR